MSKNGEAKEINDKQASFVSGGMPSPNSMTKEQLENGKEILLQRQEGR